MSTRPVAILKRFFFGTKKHPIFPFHSFSGVALQCTVNFQFFVAAQDDFLSQDFCSKNSIRYFYMCNHINSRHREK